MFGSFDIIFTKILAGGVFFPVKLVHAMDFFAVPTSMSRIAILLIDPFLSPAFLFRVACKRKHIEGFCFASLSHQPVLCPLLPLVSCACLQNLPAFYYFRRIGPLP